MGHGDLHHYLIRSRPLSFCGEDYQGVTELDDPRILKITPFDTMGTPIELLNSFGGRDGFEQAVHDLQSALYHEVA